MDFRLFGERPFATLEARDLAALMTVSEGWFVEYKEDVLPAEGIAKAISAFANTHGGYLFFGIAEGATEGSPATFPGLAS